MCLFGVFDGEDDDQEEEEGTRVEFAFSSFFFDGLGQRFVRFRMQEFRTARACVCVVEEERRHTA